MQVEQAPRLHESCTPTRSPALPTAHLSGRHCVFSTREPERARPPASRLPLPPHGLHSGTCRGATSPPLPGLSVRSLPEPRLVFAPPARQRASDRHRSAAHSPGLPCARVEPRPPRPSRPLWSAASPASLLPLSLAAHSGHSPPHRPSTVYRRSSARTVPREPPTRSSGLCLEITERQCCLPAKAGLSKQGWLELACEQTNPRVQDPQLYTSTWLPTVLTPMWTRAQGAACSVFGCTARGAGVPSGNSHHTAFMPRTPLLHMPTPRPSHGPWSRR